MIEIDEPDGTADEGARASDACPDAVGRRAADSAMPAVVRVAPEVSRIVLAPVGGEAIAVEPAAGAATEGTYP